MNTLGVDIGSISTKGVVLDESGRIVASDYLWTEGNPISAVQELLNSLGNLDRVTAVGTTGSARKLIGAMLNATIVKNEITAHAVGTLAKFPNAQTILEIGGQDSKIILLRGGIVCDYAMNTLCAAGTGAFLVAQCKRLGITMEDMGGIALSSKNPTKIAARCAVFAESDMIHKAQTGHTKQDLVAGLCHAVVANYLSNVAQGKEILGPIIFQGGVSKNAGVVAAFRQQLGLDVYVDEESHLTGAVGVAILAQKKAAGQNTRRHFSFENINFRTHAHECAKCPNNCEIIAAYHNETLVDSWGSRCDNYSATTTPPLLA